MVKITDFACEYIGDTPKWMLSFDNFEERYGGKYRGQNVNWIYVKSKKLIF